MFPVIFQDLRIFLILWIKDFTVMSNTEIKFSNLFHSQVTERKERKIF